ncbi:hypothetical protein ACFX12_034316 [Malus domestica]
MKPPLRLKLLLVFSSMVLMLYKCQAGATNLHSLILILGKDRSHQTRPSQLNGSHPTRPSQLNGSHQTRRSKLTVLPLHPLLLLANPCCSFESSAKTRLRPLPPTMSELLMGSGFDHLLEQLSEIQITDTHVGSDSHCAVCKEAFEPKGISDYHTCQRHGCLHPESKKTEIVAHDELAHEVRFEYEEFRTHITALFLVAHSRNLALVRKLLSYGANVNKNLFRGYATVAPVRERHLEMGWHNSDLVVELEYTNWCSSSRKRERAESEKKKAKVFAKQKRR